MLRWAVIRYSVERDPLFGRAGIRYSVERRSGTLSSGIRYSVERDPVLCRAGSGTLSSGERGSDALLNLNYLIWIGLYRSGISLFRLDFCRSIKGAADSNRITSLPDNIDLTTTTSLLHYKVFLSCCDEKKHEKELLRLSVLKTP